MPPQNLIQNHQISSREMYGQGLPLPWCLALVALPLISSQLLALVALFPHPSCSLWSLCLSSPPKIFIADFQRHILPNPAYNLLSSPPKFFIADFQRYFLQITAYTPLSSPPKIFIADFQRYFLQNRKHFHATSPTSVE
jgi:hypothetical protein